MTDEITITLNFTLLNGSLDIPIARSIQIDQTTALGGIPGTQLIGTTEEAIDLTELTSPGFIFIQNLDATNFVQWGLDITTFRPVGKLLPSEWCIFRLDPAIALFMRADTAECAVDIRTMDS